MASKYDPITEYLSTRATNRVSLRFADIDAMVGGLPATARSTRQWWGNEKKGSHVQARSWMKAGWEVNTVDLAGERVVFERAR